MGNIQSLKRKNKNYPANPFTGLFVTHEIRKSHFEKSKARKNKKKELFPARDFCYQASSCRCVGYIYIVSFPASTSTWQSSASASSGSAPFDSPLACSLITCDGSGRPVAPASWFATAPSPEKRFTVT